MDANKTIGELKRDQNRLENQIVDLLLQFEQTWGEDTISRVDFIRWNGSNYAFGKITRVEVGINI